VNVESHSLSDVGCDDGQSKVEIEKWYRIYTRVGVYLRFGTFEKIVEEYGDVAIRIEEK